MKGLRLENVDICYGHKEYFMDNWDMLLPFGTFCVHLVQYFRVLVSCTKKNLASVELTASINLCFSYRPSSLYKKAKVHRRSYLGF
jgi:hypothetical protein